MQNGIRKPQAEPSLHNRGIATSALWILLRTLKTFLRSVPDTVHQHALSRIANLMLRDESMQARLAPIEGRRLRLMIVDCDSRCQFQVQNQRLRPVSAKHVPNVQITGTLVDFLLLATRAEDPDTLFFSRRLSLEGETETALHFKNVIDSLDLDLQALLSAAFGERMGRSIATALTRSGADRNLETATLAVTGILRALVANEEIGR